MLAVWEVLGSLTAGTKGDGEEEKIFLVEREGGSWWMGEGKGSYGSFACETAFGVGRATILMLAKVSKEHSTS